MKKPGRRIGFFVNKYSQILISVFIAFAISDLLLIASYNFLIPEKELVPLSIRPAEGSENFSSDSYKMVWENNIFHTGPIPLELKMEYKNLEPVLSSLPFTLKGTIIHANPKRSVATVQAGADNKSFSYQPGDIIEKQAEVRRIERAKLIFFNQNNNRLEYIVIPEEKLKLNISYHKEEKTAQKVSQSSGLIKRAGNTFEVKRSDLNEYLERLPEILSQARVVPHYENGQFKGYRFASINKGSVFEKLGFEKGTVIKSVDGEELQEDPEMILDLYERRKGRSEIKILVEKDGKEVEYNYGVNENAPMNMR